MASQPQYAVPVPAPSSKTFGSRGGIMAGGSQPGRSSERPRTAQRVYWLNPNPPVVVSGLRRSDASTMMGAPLQIVRPQRQTPLAMVPPHRQVPAPKMGPQQSPVAASTAYVQQPAASSDSSYTESSSTSTSSTSSSEGRSLRTLYSAALRAFRQPSTSVGTETTDFDRPSGTKLWLYGLTAIVLTIAVTTVINFQVMAGDSNIGEKERGGLQSKQASQCNCNTTSPGSTSASPIGSPNISVPGETALRNVASHPEHPPSATEIRSARGSTETGDILGALKDLPVEQARGSNGVVQTFDRYPLKKRTSVIETSTETVAARTSQFSHGLETTVPIKTSTNDGVETARQDTTVGSVALSEGSQTSVLVETRTNDGVGTRRQDTTAGSVALSDGSQTTVLVETRTNDGVGTRRQDTTAGSVALLDGSQTTVLVETRTNDGVGTRRQDTAAGSVAPSNFTASVEADARDRSSLTAPDSEPWSVAIF